MLLPVSRSKFNATTGFEPRLNAIAVSKCSLVHHCIGYVFLENRYSIYIHVVSTQHPGVVQLKEEEMWCQIGKNYEYWTGPPLEIITTASK
jgi:hypothetical protein